MFNLNTSRKPETTLYENTIDEAISMYGIACKWLYSERINEDSVFQDFSHNKVDSSVEYPTIYLLPEDSSSWEGDSTFNSFGFFNQHTQNLFISKAGMLSLYPDFLTETGSRAEVVNSLLITPSSTILEVTHVEHFTPGINNLFAFADSPSSYKLTVKVYTKNLADDGVASVQDNIKLDEDEIFEHDEPIDTTDIDDFFSSLESVKEQQDLEGDQISNTNNPFGSLG